MAIPALFQDRLSLPAIAAPMFLVSNPDLALACCREGIVGTFPALNQRTSEGFEEWLVVMRNELARLERDGCKPLAPFGVNLIVHRTNPRWEADLELCVRHEVPLVITSLGAASRVVDAVHSYGGLVFHDVTNRKHAAKAAEAGVDGIIAVAAGAGGHAGTLSPFALLADVRAVFDGTIILAGALSTGRDILVAQAMGADFAYLGTRFISTRESAAPEEYREMIMAAASTDVIHTPAVSGIPANFLRKSLEAAGYPMDRLNEAGTLDYGEKLKPVNDEARAWKTVWSAGQGVGAIDNAPSVAELVAGLKADYRAALDDCIQNGKRFAPR